MTDPQSYQQTEPQQPYAAAPPAPPAPPQYTQAPATDPGKTLGIVGLVFAFLMPLIGLILGIIAKSQSKKVGAKNGIATAAIIISIVWLVLGTIIGIILAVFLGGATADAIAAIEACQNGASSATIMGVEQSCEVILSQNSY